MVNSTGDLVIGGYNGGSYFYGYLDEFEVVKGAARNTSGFTPSTSALIVDDYTMLMLHFEGSNDATTFTDTIMDTKNVAMTLVSDAITAADVPEKMFVVADETITSGTVAYSVSRDNGSTWTAATKDTLIDVSAQPSGSACRIKAVTSAVAADAITINAWAFGYKTE
jgi:Neuraminidase (sialidase)